MKVADGLSIGKDTVSAYDDKRPLDDRFMTSASLLPSLPLRDPDGNWLWPGTLL
jgi:hypothetical protein